MLFSPFLVFLVFRFVEDLGKYDDPDLLSKIFSIQKEKPSICIANPYLYCMSYVSRTTALDLFLPQDIGLKLLNINSEVTFPKVKELDLSSIGCPLPEPRRLLCGRLHLSRPLYSPLL